MTSRRRFPLTAWQDYIISVERKIGTSAAFTRNCTLGAALLVRPAYSAPRIKRAFAALCKKHDILRCRFEEHQGRMFCVVQDAHPTGVTVHRYDAMPMPGIEALTERHAAQPITFADDALVRLDVLDFADAGCVVLFRGHLTLLDGFAMVSLLDGLIKRLLGLPLLGRAMRYQEYMATWGVDGAPLPPAVTEFWNTKLLPPPAPLNIGRVRKGLPRLVGSRVWDWGKSLDLPVSRQQAQRMAYAASTAGVSLFAQINAAFLQALARDAQADDILYGLTLGRSDAALSRFLGHHTVQPLMCCRGAADKPLDRIAREATAELTDVMQNLPSSAARIGGTWDRHLEDAGAYPRQILTGSNLPSARISTSLFADLLALGASRTKKIGPYEITLMPRPAGAGDMSELTFRSNVDANGGHISLRYDGHAFDDPEISSLATAIAHALGLEQDEYALVG